MVDLANQLQGWTASVYKFGCAFIHLSNFHNYKQHDPFAELHESDKVAIKEHLHDYHGFSLSTNLSFESVIPYLGRVFEKIKSNLECYLKDLEALD